MRQQGSCPERNTHGGRARDRGPLGKALSVPNGRASFAFPIHELNPHHTVWRLTHSVGFGTSRVTLFHYFPMSERAATR